MLLRDLSSENLRYLSIDQALADVAHFITTIRQEPKYHESKVVVIGGSYAGTMATWFRQKYPHLAAGAWASSAPLLGKFDFKEYKEIVGQSLALVGGADCYMIVKKGFAMTEALIANNQTERMRELFNICDEFDGVDKYDVWTFFSWMSNIAASFVQNHQRQPIQSYCERFTSQYQRNGTQSDDDILRIFANVIQTFFDSPHESCTRIDYATSLRRMKQIEYTDGEYRQWIYQTCSEFGWYQTSASDEQPFGSSFPVDLNARTCREVYGDM